MKLSLAHPSIVLFVSLLFASSVEAAVFAAPTATEVEPVPPAGPEPSDAAPEEAASPDAVAVPEPAETNWSAYFNKHITVVSGGHVITGRMISHTAETVAIKEANGVVSDLPKAGITEVREVETKRDSDPALDRAPSRRSEAASAADDELGAAGSFRRRGKFFLFSPGFLAVPFKSLAPVFYRWGFSVGGVIPSQGSNFVGSYGFTFEHLVNRQSTSLPDLGDLAPASDVRSVTNTVRGLAEVRLGTGGERVFGYALVGAGVSILHVKTESGDLKSSEGAFGFAIPVGVGLQALFGERFVVGFEPRIVFDLFVGTEARAMFDARLVLGAKF